MGAVFISHSSEDNAWARRVLEWLAEFNQHSVFLDFNAYYGIRGGEKWEQKLYDQLRRSSALIPLLSPKWLESKWCFVEFAQARALGKIIIPLKIADCDPGGVISDLQHIGDLRGAEDQAKERLALALKGALVEESFPWRGDTPYPGLRAFDEADAGVFFGRNVETRDCLDALNRLAGSFGRQDARLLLMLGASGSGKSSLMRAGVLPHLRKTRGWCVLGPIIPDRQVLEELTKALAVALDWDLDRVRGRLAGSSSGAEVGSTALIELLSQLQHAARPHHPTPILAIDQAEEVLRAGDPGDRFLRLLRTVIEEGGRLVTLATMRSDSLGDFQRHPALYGFSRYEHLTLDLMPIERFRELIEGPAARAQIDIEPNLIDAIEADARTADALPLLAFTLHHLYKTGITPTDRVLELAEYKALGGIEGAVQEGAKRAFAALDASDHEREAFFQTFVPHLVDIDHEGRFVRRRAKLDHLPKAAHRLIQRFVDERLLTRGDENGATTIEVAHESLFETWAELRERLRDDRQNLILLRELRRQADAWAAAEGKKGKREAIKLWGESLKQIRTLVQQPRFALPDRSQVARYFKECIAAQRRRSLGLAMVLGSIVLAVSVGGGIAWWQRDEARRAQQIAEENAAVVLGKQLAAQSELMRTQSPRLLDRTALLAVEAARRASGLEIDSALRGAVGLLPSLLFEYTQTEPIQAVSLSPGGEWAAAGGDAGVVQVWDVATGQEIARIEHGAPVRAVVFSPDAEQLASASQSGIILYALQSGKEAKLDDPGAQLLAFGNGLLASGGADDGRITLWDTAQRRDTRSFALDGSAAAAAFSPDGRLLAAGGADNTVRVWDVATGREVMRGAHQPASASMPLRLGSRDGGVFAVAFDPSGEYLVSGAQDHTVSIWEVASGREVFRRYQTDSIYSTAISPDGRWLASGGMDETARVWNLEDGSERYRLEHGYVVQEVLWQGDDTLLTVSGDGTARLWNMATGRELSRMYHAGYIYDAAVSADGDRAITGDWEGSVRVWELRGGGAALWLAHEGTRDARYSPDGTHLATRGETNFIQLWTLPDGKPTHRFHHEPFASSVAFSPDGKIVATTGWDGMAHLWDAGTGELLASLTHQGRVVDARFSPDGRLLATAGFEDGIAGVLEVNSGRELFRLRHEGAVETMRRTYPDGGVRSITFSPSGRVLATGGQDGTVRVWDLEDGRELQRFEHRGYVLDALFTPDERYLITDSDDEIAIWSLSEGEQLASMDKEAASDPFMSVLGMSPDGQLLVVGSHEENAVQIRSIPDLGIVTKLLHEDTVFSATFRRDGARLLTASRDKTARVWDTRTWQEVTRVTADDFTYSAFYSPDEHFFVTASGDGFARIWPAEAATMIEIACGQLQRNLTQEEWRQYLGSEPYAPTCRQ